MESVSTISMKKHVNWFSLRIDNLGSHQKLGTSKKAKTGQSINCFFVRIITRISKLTPLSGSYTYRLCIIHRIGIFEFET